MRHWIGLIPLFPLAGFLVNGLVYLIGNRPQRPEPSSHDAHGEQPAAESAKDRGHPHAHMHEETHPRFRAFHSIVGVGSVALALVFAFGAILDIGVSRLAHGASHSVTFYRWIPLGVNQAVGQIPGRAGSGSWTRPSAWTRSRR